MQCRSVVFEATNTATVPCGVRSLRGQGHHRLSLRISGHAETDHQRERGRVKGSTVKVVFAGPPASFATLPVTTPLAADPSPSLLKHA